MNMLSHHRYNDKMRRLDHCIVHRILVLLVESAVIYNTATLWFVLVAYTKRFFFFNCGSEPEVVMGSKVSSKMAAPTARVLQVICV